MPSGAVDLRLRGAISGRGANLTFTFRLGSADADVGEDEEDADAVVCVLVEEDAGVSISDWVCCGVSKSSRGLGEGDDSVEEDDSLLDVGIVCSNPAI
jgi:hypothetical protein